jgi:hypothetical protein
MAQRPARARGARRPDVEWHRGDWVRVGGRHLGQVVRVEGEGRSLRLIVESATDLKQRSVNPRANRVERVER